MVPRPTSMTLSLYMVGASIIMKRAVEHRLLQSVAPINITIA